MHEPGREPPASVWTDDRLTVRQSPIHGHGLFATEDIAAGSVVVRLGGRLVSSRELTTVIAHAKADGTFVDTISICDDLHLVLPPGTKVHFGNHSCDPNTWHVGPYEVAARRAIRSGEEITIDYATESAADYEMACTCRSPLCRRTITSHDWQRPELRDRYGDHWVPVLSRRIKASI